LGGPPKWGGHGRNRRGDFRFSLKFATLQVSPWEAGKQTEGGARG